MGALLARSMVEDDATWAGDVSPVTSRWKLTEGLDGRLSFKARGILAYLLDKPAGWDVRSVAIAAHLASRYNPEPEYLVHVVHRDVSRPA